MSYGERDPHYAHPDRQTERTYSQDELDAAVSAERERAHNAGFVEASRLHGREIQRLQTALQWIASVNAMDYEYRAKARDALAPNPGVHP